MSRFTDEKRASEEAQEILRQVLPELQRASQLLAVDAGFCGIPPGSVLNEAVRRITRISQMSFQEMLDWSAWEHPDV